VVAEQAGNDGTLGRAEQLVGRQAGVDDVERRVGTARGEEDGVLRQGIGGRLAPAAARERLVHPLVVQLCPEEFLERVQARQALENVPDDAVNFALRACHSHPPRWLQTEGSVFQRAAEGPIMQRRRPFGNW